MSNKLGAWPDSNWNTVFHNLKLGIINFRRVSNWTTISDGSVKMPYFEEFMEKL
jgi:hypothetical protein